MAKKISADAVEDVLAAAQDAEREQTDMRKTALRAVIEVGFIVFLFYSNLLMGEFERSGGGRKNGLSWAIRNIFTRDNLVIAIAAALVGYVVVEVLRNRLWNRKDSK